MPAFVCRRFDFLLLLAALAGVGCISENAPVAQPSPPSAVEPASPATTVTDATPANGTPAATVKPAETDEPAAEFTPPALTVGDPAPKLQLGEWLKGESVAELAPDKTYLIEFWATWCGPCIAAMPHVTELQEKYKDSITVLGVNVHERKGTDVAAFVEKKGDVMGYAVVRDDVSQDDKGAMALTWLKPAEQHGIPCTFVVQNGKIAWIGHPMQLDNVLAEMTSGNWDIAKARADHLGKLAVQAKMQAMQQKLGQLVKAKDIDGLNALLNELTAINPAAAKNVEMMRFSILLDMDAFEQAYALNDKLFEAYQDEPQALNQIAWTILDKRGVDQRDYAMALKFAVRANELTESKNPAILDTLARAYFDKGEFVQAVETQKLAIEHAGAGGKQFEKTLKTYEAKLEVKEEPKAEESKAEVKEEAKAEAKEAAEVKEEAKEEAKPE